MWLTFESLVNARDLGGTPCEDGGEIAPGRLLRSDNLQDLTEADVAQLVELGVSDVIDLRSTIEVESEGPSPITRVPEITVHHLSFLPEADAVGKFGRAANLDTQADDPDAPQALPWVGKEASVVHENQSAAHYLSYLHDRPENVIGALRVIGEAQGAVLVHCAAGKDRTGTTVALALSLAGADRDAVVADYAASSERMQLIIDRLWQSDTYRANLEGRPLSSHMTNPETMAAMLEWFDTTHGDVESGLATFGWTTDDTQALRKKLR